MVFFQKIPVTDGSREGASSGAHALRGHPRPDALRPEWAGAATRSVAPVGAHAERWHQNSHHSDLTAILPTDTLPHKVFCRILSPLQEDLRGFGTSCGNRRPEPLAPGRGGRGAGGGRR